MTLQRLKLIPFIFFFAFLQTALAQNINFKGQINTKHFSSNDYGSAGQIWTGLQAVNGDFLFGNRQDILLFNGIEWDKIKTDTIKTQKTVRDNCFDSYVCKLYLASNDKVYVGRDNNFGYLDYSDKGELLYYPIFYGGIKNNIGRVWNIFELGNGEIMFVAEKRIYIYSKDKKLTQLEVPYNYANLICLNSGRFLNGYLFIFQKERVNSMQNKKILYYNVFSNKVSEITLPKEIYLTDFRGGFQINQKFYIKSVANNFYSATQIGENKFSWKAEDETEFKSVKDHDIFFVNKYGNYILNNTENKGLIVNDLKGNIVKTFDFSEDLASLSVNFSFFDRNNNLWLCLGNGIQFYETGSPVSFLNKKNNVNAQIETIEINEQNAFIGAHDGILYSTKANNKLNMHNIKDINEIIFDIRSFNTDEGLKTLAIGYNGIYEVTGSGDKARTEVINRAYAFKFALDPYQKNSIYLTLESGLARLYLEGGKWKLEEIVPNAGGETVSATVLNGKVYLSIRSIGLGIYDIKNKKFKVSRVKNLSADDQNNNFYVEQFQNKIYLGTANGLYEYDDKTNTFHRFEPEIKLADSGVRNTIHRIVNIDNEQLWVVIFQENKNYKSQNNLTGWFEKKGKDYIWVSSPLASLKNAGLVFALAKNEAENETWIGAVNGLYILNNDAISKRRGGYKVSIDKLDVNGKTFLYNLQKVKDFKPLKYSQNSFKVFFHANAYSSISQTLYSYKLEGFNDEWSQWSNLNFANFEKIPEGTYIFMVKAKSAYDVESEILKIEITVSPPWYRTIFAYIVYFIALIVLIYFVVHLSTQRVKKQNQKLEATVQERTKEIAEQNHQLEQQKEEIMEKTMDILDSIHYAKRIQTTILPNQSRLKELFYQHFVFYRPKDIVSGDFYWARQINNKVVFSAVDCTGHGVPGALVSIVGNNGLIRAVNEFKLIEPNDILDKLREIVVDAFIAEGKNEVKDGMDIALCTIDKKTGVLKYSGANNECLIIRNGEIIELKPDKQPIGQFIDAKPFTQKEFTLQDGDCVYMTTDGYVDQFGGDRMKKFKSKPFKALLTSIYQLDMEEQYIEIQKAFDQWKGDLDQVDDVCVFGIRYKKS